MARGIAGVITAYPMPPTAEHSAEGALLTDARGDVHDQQEQAEGEGAHEVTFPWDKGLLTAEKPHNSSPIITAALAAQRCRRMACDKQAVELLDSRIRRRSGAHDLHQFGPRDEIRDPISDQHNAVAGRERHFGTV